MAEKRAKPKGKRPDKSGRSASAKPAKRTAIVRFKFGSGADDVVLPLSEHQRILQRQYHRMADSESPELRAVGEQKLREAAENSAAAIVANIQRAKASRSKRPNARSPIRTRIIEVMRSYKQNTDFKTFFAVWEKGHIDGLRLTRFGDVMDTLEKQKYNVDDENAWEGKVSGQYTYKTLRDKLWTQA